MRKKLQIKYLVAVSMLISIYMLLHDNIEKSYHTINKDGRDSLRRNRSIKEDLNSKTNFSFENFYSKQNLYEPDKNDEQFKLYLRYKKSSNEHDSKVFYDSKKLSEKIGLKKDPKNYYLIVEYTHVFGKTKYCHQSIPENLLSKISDPNLISKLITEKKPEIKYDLLDKCHYKNCFFSCDPSLASGADAILFHETDLKNKVKSITDNHDYKKVYSEMFNFERDPSQFWILWNDEANKVEKTMDPFRFNWTISYNSKSEISYCTYGCMTQLDVRMNDSSFNILVNEQFRKRYKTALWFVSNCNAKTRLEFVDKLSQFYPIKVFGKCNQLIKETFKNKELIFFNDIKCSRDSECERKSFEENKFYFAFENNNCTDYITEKFWRSLSYDLIPIVLHPNKEYYERVAPVDSFIHLGDFDYDPKKLSAYLSQVSSDIKLYSKYFEWKKYYKSLYEGHVLEQLRLCELCDKLNNQHELNYSYYENLSNWFNRQCK